MNISIDRLPALPIIANDPFFHLDAGRYADLRLPHSLVRRA